VNLYKPPWEVTAGESFIDRVQLALDKAEAVLIILSKNFVKSSWCKKELNAGFMREIDEKRILLIPILIDDCEIPTFLKEKKYADFRISPEKGFEQVIIGLSKVITYEHGRIDDSNYTTDWATDAFYLSGKFNLRITLIEMTKDHPHTVLIEILLIANKDATKKFKNYYDNNLKFYADYLIVTWLSSTLNSANTQIRLTDQNPVFLNFKLKDSKSSKLFNCNLRARRLGEDTGFDLMVNIAGQIENIKKQLEKSKKPLTKEEIEIINQSCSR
jgi:hypothetical protein